LQRRGRLIAGRYLIGMVTLSVCLTPTACSDLEVVTASYTNLADAQPAIAAGWIPGGLPPGSRDLREAHDQDSNRRWGLFSFPVEESDALRALVMPEEIPIAGLSCDVPARIEWWPVLVRGRLDESRIRDTGLRAYRARAGDLVYLVNWNQGRAYYWTN
jgi:hypothetical protein